MTIKAYFDGSGKSDNPDCRYLTLAGYVGTEDAWAAFEKAWDRVLNRWGCNYIHMREAKHRGALRDLISVCFGDIGCTTHKTAFCGAACTVDLEAYRCVCHDLPDLQARKSPEDICVDAVVTVALRMLPASDQSETGKSGTIELWFDQDEAFLHRINRAWERKRKRPGIFKHFSSIRSGAMKESPGLQAADVLAWHTNRACVDNDQFSLFVAQTMCPSFCFLLDYTEIVKRYAR